MDDVSIWQWFRLTCRKSSIRKVSFASVNRNVNLAAAVDLIYNLQRAVLGKRHITHRVQAVFDSPMSTAQCQEGLGSIRFRWQDGDEEDHLDSRLSLFSAGASELGSMGDAGPISEAR